MLDVLCLVYYALCTLLYALCFMHSSQQAQRAARRDEYGEQLRAWYSFHGRVEKMEEVPEILEAWAGSGLY
jgi:hypothetical protein